MSQPQHFLEVRNRLGETPIWSPEDNALYWVDWSAGLICRVEFEDKNFSAFSTELPITALARRANGGWLALAQAGIYAWDPQTNQFDLVYGPPEPDNPDICYNDCAVDRQGRLLVGTVDMDDPFRPTGSVYRLDPDCTLHKIDTGYATANGIGLSPDGKTLYVAAQRQNQIIVLDYDPESGSASNRRVFATIPEEEGMPDGLIVDAEGFVWNGHWAGWKLTRYTPDGKVDRTIQFPVEHVISFAFGGKDLRTLLVTTAWWGFDEEKRKEQPLAGDLFSIQTDAKGLVEPAFAG